MTATGRSHSRGSVSSRTSVNYSRALASAAGFSRYFGFIDLYIARPREKLWHTVSTTRTPILGAVPDVIVFSSHRRRPRRRDENPSREAKGAEKSVHSAGALIGIPTCCRYAETEVSMPLMVMNP